MILYGDNEDSIVSMSNREKIIVSVMAATVFLGGYLYFVPRMTGSQHQTEIQSDEQALDFAQKVILKLKADTSLTREIFTIRSAERKWAKDPFLKSDALLSDTLQYNAPDNAAVVAITQLDLVYTGFIEAGTQRLAIINGMEYAPGEAINGQGHYLRRIHPHQIEIGKRNAPDVIIIKLTD